jgi:hypothetical protein
MTSGGAQSVGDTCALMGVVGGGVMQTPAAYMSQKASAAKTAVQAVDIPIQISGRSSSMTRAKLIRDAVDNCQPNSQPMMRSGPIKTLSPKARLSAPSMDQRPPSGSSLFITHSTTSARSSIRVHIGNSQNVINATLTTAPSVERPTHIVSLVSSSIPQSTPARDRAAQVIHKEPRDEQSAAVGRNARTVAGGRR